MRPISPSGVAAIAVTGCLWAQGPSTEAPTKAAPSAELAAIFAGGVPKNVVQLRAMQAHTKALLARILPSVIGIGGATGVIVEGGFVLTAAHVIRSPRRRIRMRLSNGKFVSGRRLGCNHQTDAGLIKLDDAEGLPALTMAEAGSLDRGEWVVMLGNPGGPKSNRSSPLRIGRILRAPERGFVMSDCTMSAGDSGGPLFDMDGRVVGINSRISIDLQANMHVPIGAFHRDWQKLIAGEVIGQQRSSRSRGRADLGIDWESEGVAAKVKSVRRGGPAARAGIQAGDVITAIGDDEVQSRRTVRRLLSRRAPGAKVQVTVRRGEKSEQIEVRLSGGR